MNGEIETMGVARPTMPMEAMTSAVSQREIAEVQSAMVIAKKFPRSQQEAIDRILNACQRPKLAESALYTYARGGTDISGPSIRLAENIAQNWGNLHCGIRELEQRPGQSTMEAFAVDMETNFRSVKVFQVAHRRHTRQGSYDLEDPRDIYEMTANQGARRLRACILSIIPGDIVEAAVKECEKTLRAKADMTPEGIKKMLDSFAQFGVTKAQIEKRIQRRLDAMTPAQKVALGNIYNSLRDNMSGPGDWFDPEPAQEGEAKEPEKKSGTAKAKDMLKKSGPADEPKTEPPQDKKEPEAGAPTGQQETESPENPAETPESPPETSTGEQEGAEGAEGAQKPGETEETDKEPPKQEAKLPVHRELMKMILIKSGMNKELGRKILVEQSAYESNGRTVAGKDKISDLTDGRKQVTLGKVKKLQPLEPMPTGCTDDPKSCDHSFWQNNTTFCKAGDSLECPYSIVPEELPL